MEQRTRKDEDQTREATRNSFDTEHGPVSQWGRPMGSQFRPLQCPDCIHFFGCHQVNRHHLGYYRNTKHSGLRLGQTDNVGKLNRTQEKGLTMNFTK